MKKEVRAKLDEIVKQISEETATSFIKEYMFIDDVDIPCLKWSYLNRFIVFLYKTVDARGKKQWQKAGRTVKEDAVPIFIFVPLFTKEPLNNMLLANAASGITNSKDNKDGTVKVLSGFTMFPTYRVEDTEGEPLDYSIHLKNFDINKLPLIDIAKALNIEVTAELTLRNMASYNHKEKKIVMGTDNPNVFLHEMSHAIDSVLPNHSNNYAKNEIIAELSAAFLSRLYEIPFSIKATRSYIEQYSGRGHAVFEIMRALSRVKEIYTFIENYKKGETVIRRPVKKQAEFFSP
jgi:hypothetical protein